MIGAFTHYQILTALISIALSCCGATLAPILEAAMDNTLDLGGRTNRFLSVKSERKSRS